MQDIIQKAKKIRLAIFDVDGVLTNGTLMYGKNGAEHKEFHAHDGQGLKLLIDSGVQIAIITAHESEVVTNRMQYLGIPHVYQGNTDKLPAYEDLKIKLKLTDEQISYMGDDVPDLPLLRRVGLSITVANSPKIIQQHACWITKANGGFGAVREVCDLIMEAQGTFQAAINKFLDR
jgi:3-deoxy-D-manno-octulosonate 8-phosphate phosphatase (KDO 8-P phosphatase)